jgi:hypothetical protein
MKTSYINVKIICAISVLLAFSISSIFAQKKNGIGNERKNFKQWTWEEVNSQALWAARAGLKVLNHNDTFYLFGGRTPLNPNEIPVPGASIIWGDVWTSDDYGITWENLLTGYENFWPARAYFQAVSKDDYMYIFGGQNFNIVPNPSPFGPPFIAQSDFFNDVWRSTDGSNWQNMTESAEWSARAGLSAVVFNNEIYVMGGSVNDDSSITPQGPARIYYNDVWKSSNGIEWELVTEHAPWAERAGGIAVVKDNYIYMIGGEEGFTCPFDPSYPPTAQPPCLNPPYFSDVWRTQNGADWELVTENAPWVARPGHQVVVAQDRLVLFGGFGLGPDNGITPANPSDIWVSNNGKIWKKVSDNPWNALGSDDIKYDFDTVVVEGYGNNSDMIFSFGGDRETFNFFDPFNYLNVDNDVWKFSYSNNSNNLSFRLNANYTNHKINGTILNFEIPENGNIILNVYNIFGEYVKGFELSNLIAGKHEINWNGKDENGKTLETGVYILKLIYQGDSLTKQIIISPN